MNDLAIKELLQCLYVFLENFHRSEEYIFPYSFSVHNDRDSTSMNDERISHSFLSKLLANCRRKIFAWRSR